MKNAILHYNCETKLNLSNNNSGSELFALARCLNFEMHALKSHEKSNFLAWARTYIQREWVKSGKMKIGEGDIESNADRTSQRTLILHAMNVKKSRAPLSLYRSESFPPDDSQRVCSKILPTEWVQAFLVCFVQNETVSSCRKNLLCFVNESLLAFCV